MKYDFKNFNLFICSSCLNGFISPIPKKMGKYYTGTYWKIPGRLGQIKNYIYNILQFRRIKWVKEYLKDGQILDIGAGEANFAKQFKGLSVESIDFPGSKIDNPDVLKVDFLKWRTNKKYDAIVFWESLEHVPDVGKYLKKTHSLLKNDGLIFIECPNFDSSQAKLFGKNWYHLDPPRHLAHFSKTGIEKVLRKEQFKPLLVNKVFSPEHIYPGFLVSSLNLLGFDPLDSYLKRSNMYLIVLLALILLPLAIIIESLSYLTGQSPIMLVVARKTK